jgi:hypothetical protein
MATASGKRPTPIVAVARRVRVLTSVTWLLVQPTLLAEPGRDPLDPVPGPLGVRRHPPGHAVQPRPDLAGIGRRRYYRPIGADQATAILRV